MYRAKRYHQLQSYLRRYGVIAILQMQVSDSLTHVFRCYWNMPADYDVGVFESCDGDDSLPMGLYGTSRWYQGVSPTPSAHPAPASSNCVTAATVGPSS
jgi:hypothetical protein